jgi:hypothetical protein
MGLARVGNASARWRAGLDGFELVVSLVFALLVGKIRCVGQFVEGDGEHLLGPEHVLEAPEVRCVVARSDVAVVEDLVGEGPLEGCAPRPRCRSIQ